MSLLLFFTVFVTCGLFATAIYQWLCQFSERTPNDVPPFLQKVDLETLYGAFHPEAEEEFRKNNTAEEFKEIQWKRLHLAIHFCNNISANSGVIQGLTRYLRKRSWHTLGPDLRQVVLELRMACLACRMAAFLIRLRLRWWLLRMTLFPWMPPPTFKTLAQIGSTDMISFYEQVRTNIEALSLACGEDYHNRLMQAL